MMTITPSGPDDFSWSAVVDIFPFLAELDDCKQDPIHHQEGDVGTHTRMVIRELVKTSFYADLEAEDRFKLFWTAVFHDSGKPETSQTNGDRITTNGHSRVGNSIARRHLRDACVPFQMREEICALIMAHQQPFWLYEHEEREQKKRAIRASLQMTPLHLLRHALADARGRISATGDNLEDKVALSSIVFEELDIINRPFEFANAESRVSYFDHENRDPHYAARADYRSNVTLMCGLPGSGKDTWIAHNKQDVPVLSPDDLRIEMGILPTDNQGTLRQVVKERAKEYLRSGQDFVWNATNVTTDMRGPILSLLRDYHAHIEIVYVETTPDKLIEQNGQRKASVPVDVIDRLARKLDPPKPWEAHVITHILDDDLKIKLYDAPVMKPGS